MSIAGVVLVGGKSRRMGADKAIIDFDGQTLAEIAVAALTAAGVAPVATVGPFTASGAEQQEDEWPGEGPLAGIVTGLNWAQAAVPDVEAVVVVACDLPFLDEDAVRALLAADEKANVEQHANDATLGFDGARPQPLFVVLRRSAFEPLRAAFAAGERSPKLAYEALSLSVAESVADGRLADVDTPTELATAREQKGRVT